MRAVIATAQRGRWGPPPPPNLSPLRRDAASRKYDWRHAVPSGANVHCSDDSVLLAPMVRSKRSVVARSAAIPFSSCPIDLHPFADRGSFNMSRSAFFWRHSMKAWRPVTSYSRASIILPWIDGCETTPNRHVQARQYALSKLFSPL